MSGYAKDAAKDAADTLTLTNSPKGLMQADKAKLVRKKSEANK
jgi:hypothetical protein